MAAPNVHPRPNINNNHGDLQVIPNQQLAAGDHVYVCMMIYDDGPYWYYGTIQEIAKADQVQVIEPNILPAYRFGDEYSEVVWVKVTHLAELGDWRQANQAQENEIFERRFIRDNDADMDEDENGRRIYFYRVPQAAVGGRRRRSTRRRRGSKKRRSTRRK